MNKDQVKGAVKDVAGKVQEKAGKVVGSKEQEAKGFPNRLPGSCKKRLEI